MSALNYLSESQLISKMTEKGIGTDGSLPKNIAKICARKYVEVIFPKLFIISCQLFEKI